ncbi:DUF1308 domain-containing protein [Nostoc punctiforme]|uniref:DUF1308 domain-containing protein n=1 Tax=Nostoc punctiforme (strain ATCC 29133 / PCC 73102) TaxID=63737 RepID=B2J6L5_NOSP7|nr:DUF1308 domain-containing protein [Nostoc punctiforme]ACC82420.1 hypothetical protein Npun_F4041 [Nostoc punctiforme PCC 73102]
MINLDTNTAVAFIVEGSPVRYELQGFVNKQMVIAQTAFNEFVNIVQYSAGSLEQTRANRFLQRVTVVPDNPSAAA